MIAKSCASRSDCHSNATEKIKSLFISHSLLSHAVNLGIFFRGLIGIAAIIANVLSVFR